MRPSASGNSGDWPDCSSPACGPRIRLRRKPGTPRSRRVLRDSSSTGVRGPNPTEPESWLSQEQVYLSAYLSSMARVAISQALNVILLDELFSELFLVGRRLISHAEHLVARAYVLLGIAVTIDAPVHVQRVFFVRERHLVHAAVTGGASDALVDMNTVIEVYKIRQVVDARPFQRFPAPVAGAHGFQNLGVRPDLRMAAHAALGRRYSGEGRRLYRRVAVPAIDAVIGDVVLVAEGDGLRFDHLNVGDVGAAVHGVGESEESARSKYSADKAYLRNCVSASMKDLSHAA